MEETMSQTQDRWSYGLLKNNVSVAPEGVRTSLEIGNEEGVLIHVQGLSVTAGQACPVPGLQVARYRRGDTDTGV